MRLRTTKHWPIGPGAAGHVSGLAVAPSVAVHADDETPSYIVRNAMTAKDMAFNGRRPRREGKTKLR
jgi:hypothetical protein